MVTIKRFDNYCNPTLLVIPEKSIGVLDNGILFMDSTGMLWVNGVQATWVSGSLLNGITFLDGTQMSWIDNTQATWR